MNPNPAEWQNKIKFHPPPQERQAEKEEEEGLLHSSNNVKILECELLRDFPGILTFCPEKASHLFPNLSLSLSANHLITPEEEEEAAGGIRNTAHGRRGG